QPQPLKHNARQHNRNFSLSFSLSILLFSPFFRQRRFSLWPPIMLQIRLKKLRDDERDAGKTFRDFCKNNKFVLEKYVV
ncbi:hypothetical protein VIGAN_07075400, partial [Vigna angularis var. angularis]